MSPYQRTRTQPGREPAGRTWDRWRGTGAPARVGAEGYAQARLAVCSALGCPPRYIQNPLLLDGKKFDVRAYLLVACAAPYMVFFGHGYARLTLNLYDPHSQDLSGHLTNQVRALPAALGQDHRPGAQTHRRPSPLGGLGRPLPAVSVTGPLQPPQGVLLT